MVIVFFMDGVKYDMMEKYMPFLESLNNKRLLSEFGYSCACHATMYTSQYIEDHGTWFIWEKGDDSPYKWINKIPFLKHINFLPLKLVLGKITRKLTKNTSYPGVPCLVNLPLKYWDLFQTSENVMWNDKNYKKHIPNMFTILEKEKIKSKIIALHKGTKVDDVFIEETQVDYKNDEFVYFFIGYTDNIMHSYGENDIASQSYLSKVDDFIRKSYEKACVVNEEVNLIAFSDHGHIDIDEPKIDINDYFKQYNIKVNNYIHLIEANFARFWIRNKTEEDLIIKVLKDLQNDKLGYILTKKHLEKYHLNLDEKVQGDIIFYLDAPREFTKTIWGFGKSVKSGHGFEPTIPKHHGIFCSNKKIIEGIGYVHLVDILPSVLGQLNINNEQYDFKGKDILEK